MLSPSRGERGFTFNQKDTLFPSMRKFTSSCQQLVLSFRSQSRVEELNFRPSTFDSLLLLWSKNGRPDSNEGSALLDCDFKVVAHAH